jgi:hypothetical protein
MLLLLSLSAPPSKAEFIGNAFGGKAEETTRAAAAAAFGAYESFYAAMALLERRARLDAKNVFLKSAEVMSQARRGYEEAAGLIDPKLKVSTSRASDGEFRAMMQFVEQFGLKLTTETPRRDLLISYARSFERTEKLISSASGRELSLKEFQEIQSFISRQIYVGTLITNVLKD